MLFPSPFCVFFTLQCLQGPLQQFFASSHNAFPSPDALRDDQIMAAKGDSSKKCLSSDLFHIQY